MGVLNRSHRFKYLGYVQRKLFFHLHLIKLRCEYMHWVDQRPSHCIDKHRPHATTIIVNRFRYHAIYSTKNIFENNSETVGAVAELPQNFKVG